MADEKHPQAAVLVGARCRRSPPMNQSTKLFSLSEILHIATQQPGDRRRILGAQW